MNEEWRPVVGHEDAYEVSDLGRVRSLDRMVIRSHGLRQMVIGRVLTPQVGRSGHLRVKLTRGRNYSVHRLVLEAFVGPCPEGMEACHDPDPDPTNNRPGNLRWDTHAANNRDTVQHGRHGSTRRTHCPQRHQLVEPNLVRSIQRRSCRACHNARNYSRTRPGIEFRPLADKYYAEIMGEQLSKGA